MARRRRVGDALSNIGAGLTDFAFNRMGQEHQSKLIGDRQRELADQNAGNRLLEEIAKNPELAERLGDRPLPGGLTARAFTLTPEQRMAKTREGLTGVNTIAELPTDIDLEVQSRSKDPEAVTSLINQRNDRRGMIQSGFTPIKRDWVNAAGVKTSDFVNPFDPRINEALPTERTGEQEGQRGLATWMANEGDPTRNATERANSVLDQRALIPGAVSQASQVARVQGNEQLRVEDERSKRELESLRKVREAAANDPVIGRAAEQVLLNPEQLKMVPAKDRTYVMAALQSDKFRTQTQRATQQILDTAVGALNQLESNKGGIEGMTGSIFLDPSRWTWNGAPYAGSEAANATAVYNQLKSALVLPKLEYLKGLGHMSDLEFGTVMKAATALDTATDETMFNEQLGIIRENLRVAYGRAGLPMPDGIEKAAPPPEVQKRDALRRSGGQR